MISTILYDKTICKVVLSRSLYEISTDSNDFHPRVHKSTVSECAEREAALQIFTNVIMADSHFIQKCSLTTLKPLFHIVFEI